MRSTRGQGIATGLLAYLRARGITKVRGPFTEDGAAFVKKAAARHPLHRVRAAARPAADARADLNRRAHDGTLVSLVHP